MKKLFLSIFFLLNISIGFNNGNIKFHALQTIYAQQRMDCPPMGGGGGGFWSWLSGIRTDIGTTINNIRNSISEFFDNMDTGDNEGMGDEDYGDNGNNDYGFDGNAFDSYPPDGGNNPWDAPTFNDYNWGMLEQDFITEIYHYNEYYTYAVAGFPPVSDTTRTDTVSATKVICDSTALAKGNKLTKVYDSVKNKPDMMRLQDSALNGTNESGLTIIKNNNSYNTWNFQTGAAQAVEVITSSSYHNCVAGVHSHPNGSANTPSPGDLYHLAEGWLDNNDYFTDFIVANDGSDFAIMIDDTARTRDFLIRHPRDSTIQVANWDSTRITAGTGNTYYADYFDYMVKLYNKNKYPLEVVQAYANVIMLAYRMGTGVKMYKRVNGQFKQLNVKVVFDAYGNEFFTIEICS